MKKSSIALLVLVVVLMSWFLFCTPLRAAYIHFDYITDPSLVNKGVGGDGIWADPHPDIADNSAGATSFNWWDSGSSVDYLTGSWEALLPEPAPGTNNIDEATADPEFGSTWTLNKSETRTITFNDAQHYNSEFTMTADSTDYLWEGGGYVIYNAPGYDDPSIFAGEIAGQVEANLTFMKTIVPTSWTAITTEYFSYGGETLAVQGFVVQSWTDDPEVLATVPIPGALWLLGSGLVGLGVFRRKFKT
jgi:hypothetical protein